MLDVGLFSKAILQSGSALCPWAFNYAPAEKLKKLLKQLDINGFSNSNKTEVITKLRRLDARAIAAQRLNYDVCVMYEVLILTFIKHSKLTIYFKRNSPI